jgi:hypothetical protein
MLVARRDPYHPGAHDASLSERGDAVPRLARTMSALQIIGTVLAIPVGIGSAYSMYRANFSVETTCQGLRSNIVSMLDKSVDASTRHMLVRRDVETFEHACGGVDPDATAAFKALLAADNTAAPGSAAAVRHAVAPPKEAVHADLAGKTPAVTTAKTAAEAAPVQRDASSDARWLEAVRGALVTHAPEQTPAAEPPVAAAVSAPARPMPPDARVASPAPAPVTLQTEPAVITTSAPELPPATSVATLPAQQADADHPVPPEPIPENVTPAEAHSGSRLSQWIGQIPLVGALAR